MRNLKRVLALAMALVMILGMMVIGSSAAKYSDESAIDAKYADAVEILTGMGVFEGTGAGFAPKQILDRASAAALVYRVITGDVTNKQTDLYDFSSFADVKEGVWYTPYITYAADNGYIKGYNGNAMPNDTVTGIQVLAIMLRAAGYGQNGEFEGAGWKDGILTAANDLGITAGISTNDLDKGASRELVAQLLFNVISKVKTVAYTPVLNTYIPVTYNVEKDGTVKGMKLTQTLGEKVFGLTEVEDVYDEWGRPSTIWTNGKPFDVATGKNVYAVIEDIPVATYTVATSECDIAKDLGLKAPGTVSKITYNGDAVAVSTNPTITLPHQPWITIGEQGQLVEIYKQGTPANPTYELVLIDTYLAQVTGVEEIEYDKNGHIDYYAELDLKIYAEDNNVDVTLKDVENWPYAKGDMLLVYYDNAGINLLYADAATDDWNVEIVDYAPSVVGAQTSFITSDDAHIVNGTKYMDAYQFNQDDANAEIVDHTWYFDSYGNLIGAFDIDTIYSYGTISSIYWQDSFGGENGFALATITYMDGTTSTEKVYSITGEFDATKAGTETNVLYGVEGKEAVYKEGAVSSTKQYNDTWMTGTTVNNLDGDYTNVALYRIESTKLGLKLVATTPLANAKTETGVPAMTANVNAGDSTMFLVWNPITKAYETYTGIDNVPTYTAGNFWYVDKRNDKVADYVFIGAPTAASSAKTVTYFWNTTLETEYVLNKFTGGVEYYVVTGGYVNGTPTPVYVYNDANASGLLAALEACKDQLVTLRTVDGYVTIVTPVTDIPTYLVAQDAYAVYALDCDSASLVDGVLMADGQAYHVTTAATIGGTLAKAIKDSKDATKATECWLYVIYTVGRTGEKTATLIYIADEAGVVGVEELDAFEKAEVALTAPMTTAELTAAKAGLVALDDAKLTNAEKTYKTSLIAEIDAALVVTAKADAKLAVKDMIEAAVKAKDTTGAVADYTKVTEDATTTISWSYNKVATYVTAVNNGIDSKETVEAINSYVKAVKDTDVEPLATAYVNAVVAAKATAEANKQVTVNGKPMSLVDAVANSAVGSTIVLEADVDVDTAINVTKGLTINLNGKTLTIKNDTKGDGVFHVTNSATLTINGDGIVNGVGKSEYCMAIWADGGNVIINGGTYTNVGANTDPGSTQYDLIYAKSGTITINGGTFKCETPQWTLNCKDNNNGTIVVKGGTFLNYNPAAAYTEPTQPQNFVATGYEVIDEIVAGGVEYTVIKAAQ